MTEERMIAALKQCADKDAGCGGCPFENRNWCSDLLMNEAADMIWRLNKTLNKTLDRVGARCG